MFRIIPGFQTQGFVQGRGVLPASVA